MIETGLVPFVPVLLFSSSFHLFSPFLTRIYFTFEYIKQQLFILFSSLKAGLVLVSMVRIFFVVVTPSGVHLFSHLLWPIFQSSILFTHYIIQFSSSYRIYESETLRGSSKYIRHVPKHQLDRIDRLCAVAISIQIVQLLILIEKLSPLPGFESLTSPVPS